jgi:selenium-binding protein 1
MRGWMGRVDANPAGGMALAADFFVDFGELRAHQVRIEGGDSASDPFCYP